MMEKKSIRMNETAKEMSIRINYLKGFYSAEDARVRLTVYFNTIPNL